MTRLARAHLTAGGHTLVMPINPYTANWGYQENTVSRDTLGGRVVQLLSVAVTDLSIQSVAGSRRELQKVAESARQVMEYHVSTLQPAIFVVPSRKWSFKVYLTAMPQMGWDVASTTYPYQLQMSIDEDLSGIKSRQIQAGVLERLYKGVGYNPHVHGGDAGAFNKLVKTVISASGGPGGGTSSGGGTGGITGGRAPGTSGINPNKGSLTMDEIAKLAAWAFGNETNMSSNDLVKNTIYATAVCIPESGGHVGSNNTAATNGTAYGLWQGNATNGVSIAELQTAEGNATWMAREVQADYALSQSDNPFALRTWEHAWWAYWGAFRSGAYKSHMSEARRATAKVF